MWRGNRVPENLPGPAAEPRRAPASATLQIHHPEPYAHPGEDPKSGAQQQLIPRDSLSCGRQVARGLPASAGVPVRARSRTRGCGPRSSRFPAAVPGLLGIREAQTRGLTRSSLKRLGEGPVVTPRLQMRKLRPREACGEVAPLSLCFSRGEVLPRGGSCVSERG